MEIENNSDMISCFSAILDFFELMNKQYQLGEQFSSALDDQRENIVNLKCLVIEYFPEILKFDASDKIESGVTLHKIIEIHTFITNIEWYVSEISELKDEYMDLIAQKRGLKNNE